MGTADDPRDSTVGDFYEPPAVDPPAQNPQVLATMPRPSVLTRLVGRHKLGP